MEKEVLKIKKNEEKNYYKLLIEAIEKSNKKPNNEIEASILKEELELIHLGMHSKQIYFLSIICEKIRNNGEPFIVCGTAAGLFTCYILKISKINPIQGGCRYETCLGIKNMPAEKINVSISVSSKFYDKLKHIVEHLIDSKQIYREGRKINDHDIRYNSDVYTYLPEKMNIEKYFEVANDSPDYFPILFDKNNNIGVTISIEVSKWYALDLYIELKNKIGLVDYRSGAKDYANMIINGYFEGLNIQSKISEFVQKNKSYGINELVSLYAKSVNSYKPGYQHLANLPSDRDSLLNDLLKFGVNYEDAYSFVDAFLKGEKINNIDNYNFDKTFKNGLENAIYLWPRAPILEMLYYQFKIASYKRNYPNDFIEIYSKYLRK